MDQIGLEAESKVVHSIFPLLWPQSLVVCFILNNAVCDLPKVFCCYFCRLTKSLFRTNFKTSIVKTHCRYAPSLNKQALSLVKISLEPVSVVAYPIWAARRCPARRFVKLTALWQNVDPGENADSGVVAGPSRSYSIQKDGNVFLDCLERICKSKNGLLYSGLDYLAQSLRAIYPFSRRSIIYLLVSPNAKHLKDLPPEANGWLIVCCFVCINDRLVPDEVDIAGLDDLGSLEQLVAKV